MAFKINRKNELMSEINNAFRNVILLIIFMVTAPLLVSADYDLPSLQIFDIYKRKRRNIYTRTSVI